jgi:hypothetical protein
VLGRMPVEVHSSSRVRADRINRNTASSKSVSSHPFFTTRSPARRTQSTHALVRPEELLQLRYQALHVCQVAEWRGRAYSHHIPLARLKCTSEKPNKELDWGSPPQRAGKSHAFAFPLTSLRFRPRTSLERFAHCSSTSRLFKPSTISGGRLCPGGGLLIGAAGSKPWRLPLSSLIHGSWQVSF